MGVNFLTDIGLENNLFGRCLDGRKIEDFSSPGANPDKMPQNVAFHQVLHCLKQKFSSGIET